MCIRDSSHPPGSALALAQSAAAGTRARETPLSAAPRTHAASGAIGLTRIDRVHEYYVWRLSLPFYGNECAAPTQAHGAHWRKRECTHPDASRGGVIFRRSHRFAANTCRLISIRPRFDAKNASPRRVRLVSRSRHRRDRSMKVCGPAVAIKYRFLLFRWSATWPRLRSC